MQYNGSNFQLGETMNIMSFLKWPKMIVETVYEKIATQASNANTTVKEFVGKDENIAHISLVVYDVLPLAFKLGLRYDKFHEGFAKNFKLFRSKIYSYEDEMKAKESAKQEQSVQIKPEPEDKPKKTVAKKTVAKKAPAKKVATKKTGVKTSSSNSKSTAKPRTRRQTKAETKQD